MAQPTDYTQYTILYVDDEEQALKYFKKGFAGEFQVLTAPNVAAANAILDAENDRIAVVISDQRMPGAVGTSLLARVRERWPHIVRILVTAYAELESAIDAVNSGSVFKYITKPVDWDDLRIKLTHAIDQHIAMKSAGAAAEKDASAVRRQIVADRVRSLSTMAAGINHHVRNSITALSCFLEEANPTEAASSAAPADPYLKNLWTAATEERDQLIARIDQIHHWLTPTSAHVIREVPVDTLVQNAIAQLSSTPGVHLTPHGTTSSLHIAAEPTARALATLINYTLEHSAHGAATVSVLSARTVHKIDVLPVQISGVGPEWTQDTLAALFTPFDVPEDDPSELGLAMTAAFSFIYQIGGDILVHPAAPQGPGFEVLLPLKPITAAAAA